jgi:hypothetical protein
MEIDLTKAQYDEMEILANAMTVVKLRTSGDGELEVNGTKVEWEDDEVKFTLSD